LELGDDVARADGVWRLDVFADRPSPNEPRLTREAAARVPGLGDHALHSGRVGIRLAAFFARLLSS
jgi:hypothetical protein